jgi:hypothetical protein
VGRVGGVLWTHQHTTAGVEDGIEVRFIELGQLSALLVVELVPCGGLGPVARRFRLPFRLSDVRPLQFSFRLMGHCQFAISDRHHDNLPAVPSQISGLQNVSSYRVAEARQLKGGKWRIYGAPELDVARDPQTGAIAIFDSLEGARHWSGRLHPSVPPLQEAIKCARCGAYFGPMSSYVSCRGRYYHPQHTPQAADVQRRR